MYMKSILLNVPVSMSDDLDKIAQRENKPRSYVMREMLEVGIRHRQLNHTIKDIVDGVKNDRNTNK